MVALQTPKIHRHKASPRNVPEQLVYEIIDGQPYYYKGYRDVLKNLTTSEEIMGCSSLQWVIIQYLLRLLFQNLNEKQYWIATNEPGLHLDRRNNFSGDILVFNKATLPGSGISTKYAAVPSVLHLEVDIAAELDEEPSAIYLEKKVNRLLEFGTGKVIWIFTKNKKILIADAQTNWQWFDWSSTLPLIENIHFNIADYLIQENITLD